jgi:hypothetical protein
MNEMMNEMMAECCDDNGKPDFNKMNTFMEKCGKQDFSEEELATMCEATRFSFEKHCCGPAGRPDTKQMKQLFGDCNCRSGS